MLWGLYGLPWSDGIFAFPLEISNFSSLCWNRAPQTHHCLLLQQPTSKTQRQNSCLNPGRCVAAFLQRGICFHRGVSKQDCNFVLCSFNQDPPSAYLRVLLPTASHWALLKASHHSLCCSGYIWKHKCHHRTSWLERDSQGSWSPTPAQDNPVNHTSMFVEQIITSHSCTGLNCTNICHSIPQHRELLQSITASQLTANPMLPAKPVYTTWLTWHKSPMMFQASATNWFNKSQPRKFFLHITVKTTRTFCDTAHTHGAVYVLLIWFAH